MATPYQNMVQIFNKKTWSVKKGPITAENNVQFPYREIIPPIHLEFSMVLYF